MLGLDIQPDAARLIQLSKARRGSQIERIAMRPMPANIFTAGRIQRWEVLGSVLVEWFEELGIRQHVVAISLPMNVVRVQQISLSASLQDAEIEAAIFSHLQRDMPGLNEPLMIDFNVLGKKQGQVTVLFMAVREAYLTNYVECLQAIGLKVKIVDVDVYALMRLVNVTYAAYAILHVKNKVTEFIVFSQQEVIFHQQWQTGEINEWMEQLNDNVQLYFSMPEKKELQRVVVCGSDEYISIAASSFRDCHPRESGDPILCHAYFSTYKTLEGSIPACAGMTESDFLVAYSLAARETPPW